MALGGRQVVVPGVASILRSLVGARSPAPVAQDVLLKPDAAASSRARAWPARAWRRRPGECKRERQCGTRPRGRRAGRRARARRQAGRRHRWQPRDPRSNRSQVRIEADPRLNAIIVRDLDRAAAALRAADRRARRRAAVARDRGHHHRRQHRPAARARRRLALEQRRQLGAAFSGAVPTIGPGGIASVVLGSAGQFIARIRALQTEGAARVVSSPQVVTLSNVEARVRQQLDLLRARGRPRGGRPVQRQRRHDAARHAACVPRCASRRASSCWSTSRTATLTGRQVDQIPVVERSTINTQALIAEGESLLIGGMVRDSSVLRDRQGAGARRRAGGGQPVQDHDQAARARIERMFLITPRLAGTAAAPAQHARWRGRAVRGSAGTGAGPGRAAGRLQAAPHPLPAAPAAAQPRPRRTGGHRRRRRASAPVARPRRDAARARRRCRPPPPRPCPPPRMPPRRRRARVAAAQPLSRLSHTPGTLTWTRRTLTRLACTRSSCACSTARKRGARAPLAAGQRLRARRRTRRRRRWRRHRAARGPRDAGARAHAWPTCRQAMIEVLRRPGRARRPDARRRRAGRLADAHAAEGRQLGGRLRPRRRSTTGPTAVRRRDIRRACGRRSQPAGAEPPLRRRAEVWLAGMGACARCWLCVGRHVDARALGLAAPARGTPRRRRP